MYNKLISKKTKLSVIGLGYVGLPIALEFAKKIKVISSPTTITTRAIFPGRRSTTNRMHIN